MITLATVVELSSYQSQGHCGVKTTYVVAIKTEHLTIYPAMSMQYDSAGCSGSLESARNWANEVADALGLDVVEKL